MIQTKIDKINELKRQIREIEKEKDVNYELIKVTPENPADMTETVAICEDLDILVAYSEEMYSYSPSLTGTRPDDDYKGKNAWSPWFKIEETDIVMVGQSISNLS